MYQSNPKTMYNLLLRNYPRYETLRSELIKLFYRKALAVNGGVDCYVDLNSYLNCIYSRHEEYVYDAPLCICSSIINFGAFIKEFFASRFNITARIFFVYGNSRNPSTTQYCPDYDAHNELDKMAKTNITAYILEDLKGLEMLCPYIPDVYFIKDDSTETAVIMRHMIKYQSSIGRKQARLIFTKDMFAYQLVGICPNTHIIRVVKTKQGDKTYTISYFDFYGKLSKEIGLKRIIGEGVSPELYSVYMTFAGCRSKNVKALVNYPKADAMIKDAIAKGNILNGYNASMAVDPMAFKHFFCLIGNPDEGINPMIDTTYLLASNRFKSLDVIHQQNLYSLNPSSNATITKPLVDQYNPDKLRYINDKMFIKYPLDLNAL